MKKLTFRGMLDNLRSSVAGVADAVTGANKFDSDPDENVRPQDYAFSEVSRHGFPHDPTAIAFEPVQRILAIGTRQGSIRLIGRPGVDYHLRQSAASPNGSASDQDDRDALLGSSSAPSHSNAILQILFLINEGTFVVVSANSWLHLWSYKGKKPEIVQSLEFQKEALTVCHVPYQSKWLFVGTEKGNVHVVQVDNFTLSGYIINWNKAMDLASRNHPGKVNHLSDCPCDSGKLLIGFDSGLITLWDLKAKAAEQRFQTSDNLCYISWHFDGKQFVSSHSDGTLIVWNIKVPGKPTSVTTPHARRAKDDPVIPIAQVEWKKHKTGTEPLLLFSGGVSFDQKGSSNAKITKTKTMTVICGKSTTVLEMEHPIVSFLCIPAQPWQNEGCDMEAVLVLLENDLVAIDLVSPGYPLYENPYAMDLHEPSVLNCQYVADCPGDIIPTLYQTGSKHKKMNFTNKEWPIDGGQWGDTATGYSDFLLTSHAEGTLRFWDISSATLQHLERVKISKIFERVKKASTLEDAEAKTDIPPVPVKSFSSMLDGPFDIQMVSLDKDCRYLAVACLGGTVILYLWNKQETSSEVSVLDIASHYNSHENSTDAAAPVHQTPPPPRASSASATSQNSLEKQDNSISSSRKIKVKLGIHKRAAGYQPVLVCFMNTKKPSPSSCSSNSQPALPAEESPAHAAMITSLAVCSKYGLMAVGDEIGLAVIDIIQKYCVINISTPDLYGSGDPYNRGYPSPKPENDQHLEPAPNIPAGSASPKHGAANSSLGASNEKTKPVSLYQKPKLQRDKSQAPHQRTAVLQRMQSLALSFDSDALSQPRRRAPRHSSKDRAYHSSLEKTELSRSRSSSTTSLDVITSEAILCLTFADTYGKRADSAITPCLWIGTELGSILVLTFQVPSSSSADPSQPQQTQRLSQPVIGTPTGTLFRYNNSGSVLAIGFLDARGAILSDAAIAPANSTASKEDTPTRAHRPLELSNSNSTAIPPLISLFGDTRHILVICMEKQIRTFILPNQGLYQKFKLQQDQNSGSGATFLKASIEKVKGASTNGENACIFCFLSTGRIAIYSLPTLKPLLDVAISQPNDLRIARTLSFGQHGNAVYFVSKSELQKVTFSAEMTATVNELRGKLYTTRETVEVIAKQSAVPSVSFLKGLIGNNSGNALTAAQQQAHDREELFGETAGKPSRSVARHVPGNNAAMEHAKTSSNMANSEIGRAKLLAIERGEKLSEIEETTERMRLQAEAFSSNANQLANKYKEKKWYQL